jgi:photosystem II stability/assembly factor-like uncharacterized protein
LGFADRQNGWLGNIGINYYPGVTDSHPLYRTRDGGASWEPVSAPGIERVAGICGIDVLPVQRIFQGELRTGHVITAGGRVGGPALILRSDDDGEAAGNLRVVVKTSDGGRSWKELPLAELPKLQQFGIGFASEKLGWVGTSQGGFETRDGGKSWTRAELGRAVNKIRVLPKPDGGQRLFAIGVEVHRLDLP